MPCPESFFLQYLETALWSSMDDSDIPLDSSYTTDDIAPETLIALRADCDAFYDANQETIDKYDAETCGHDFWLTRNGHGAGFWDGDYPNEDGDKLTAASKIYGGVNLYVGDDGLIYVL